jgi:cyclase
MRALLEKNKNFSDGDLTEEERASYESDIRLAELALADAPSAPAILPTLALENRITLYRGNRVVDIRHLERGHTAGDLVVHLPKERIVIAGDLVVWPVPLVGNPQSAIGDWTSTLQKLQELQPALIVPGHGPVMHDDSYIKMLVRLFTSVKRQVDARLLGARHLNRRGRV